jgi:hypothetical protein
VVLGNSYPAIQLDDRGEPVDSGVVLQFTDNTDQPGSGGGGGTGVVNAALRVQGLGGFGTVNDAANILGPGATGEVDSLATVWVVVGAMGQVASLAAVAYVLSGLVEETADTLDISLSVSVVDSLGVNAAIASGGFSVPQPVTDLASTNTLDGGTWAITSGTDLAASGNALNSTAGGLFFITAAAKAAWD